VPPNGVRYPRVGGMRQSRFAGTNFKPHKVPENAVTPTRRVHAVLGGSCLRKTMLQEPTNDVEKDKSNQEQTDQDHEYFEKKEDNSVAR
jgi:hypothetical protein